MPVKLQGAIDIPGDKSISHRALMMQLLLGEKITMNNCLQAQDTIATQKICDTLLAAKHLPSIEPMVFDCQNSGTTMRLMSGILVGKQIHCQLIGDVSLMSRPMNRIIEPLTRMGADISCENGRAPIAIKPVNALSGIEYRLKMPSAQVKSAILLAGLQAAGDTLIYSAPSRDHTERMLQYLGAEISYDQHRIQLKPSTLTAKALAIPGDFSSAAFWLVAATLLPGSKLKLHNVGVNPTRTGLLSVLEHMGAKIQLTHRWQQCGEPRADILVEAAKLTAVDVPAASIPLLIDEVPILMVAASQAEGVTKIAGLAELRHKESNRLENMVNNLQQLGIDAWIVGDDAFIRGGMLQAADVDSFGDHRIAMSMLVAQLLMTDRMIVKHADCVDVSYPDFIATLKSLTMA